MTARTIGRRGQRGIEHGATAGPLARALGGLALVAVLVGGCARAPGRAIVSGSVQHKNAAVVEGIVWFSDPIKGRVDSTSLRSGTFAFVSPLDVGDRLVMITPEQYPSEPPHPMPGTILFKEAKDIPKKYHAEATSGLKYTLVPGKNEFTIQLE